MTDRKIIHATDELGAKMINKFVTGMVEQILNDKTMPFCPSCMCTAFAVRYCAMLGLHSEDQEDAVKVIGDVMVAALAEIGIDAKTDIEVYTQNTPTTDTIQ